MQTVGPLQRQTPNYESKMVQAFIEKDPHRNGPVQFKRMLFKG